MNPFYWVIRTVFRPILKIWNRLEVRGLEHVPSKGPAIVVANHHSYLDAFVLGAACPLKIRFMVKRSQFTKTGTGWFYWGMDAFPVNQDGRDMESLREAMRTLRDGGVLGIFPAGERAFTERLGHWKTGVGMLARRSRVAVIPAALQGTHSAFPRGGKFPWPRKVRVIFGASVALADGGGKEDLENFVRELRTRVNRMLETGRPVAGPLKPAADAAKSG